MKIIVAGCGKVGKTILRALSDEKHDIIAIDNNTKVVDDIQSSFDCLTYCGNVTDVRVLKEAGAENASIIFAVTESDETNMQACLIAKKMGTRHTVARIREIHNNDETNIGFKKDLIGLSYIINPEFFTAQSIYDILRLPFSSRVETFGQKRFELIEFTIEKNTYLDGLTISKFKMEQERVLFGIVKRGTETIIPNGAFKLKAGDILGILVSEHDKDEVFKKFELNVKPVKNVFIVGGSLTAYYLAKRLSQKRIKTTIFEIDRDRAKELSLILPNHVSVICGNGLDKELLLEEGYRHCDAFINLTGLDEQNILSSYVAQKDNIQTVVTKINQPNLAQTARDLKIECIVSPQDIVSSITKRYVRAHGHGLGSKIETLYSIIDDTAVAVEIIVNNNVIYVDKKLRDLSLAPNTIVAGIIRNNDTIIPNGDDQILDGDRIIVISTNKNISSLEDVFVN